jgi:hypothetical protein
VGGVREIGAKRQSGRGMGEAGMGTAEGMDVSQDTESVCMKRQTCFTEETELVFMTLAAMENADLTHCG